MCPVRGGYAESPRVELLYTRVPVSLGLMRIGISVQSAYAVQDADVIVRNLVADQAKAVGCIERLADVKKSLQ